MAKVTQQVSSGDPRRIGPAGHRVLVRPKKVEEKVGSIILVDETKEKDRRAEITGTVVQVGFQAFKSHAVNAVDESVRGVRWVEVGDEVVFSRYAGVDLPEAKRKKIDPTADRLVILNDEDINFNDGPQS